MHDTEEQRAISSQIGAAIQHMVDVERTCKFDRLDRLTLDDQYKLHAATGEAMTLIRNVLSEQQLCRMKKLFVKSYERQKAQATKYHPTEWTYAKAVRRVLNDVLFKPYLYNMD